jgi:hypothetical protein
VIPLTKAHLQERLKSRFSISRDLSFMLSLSVRFNLFGTEELDGRAVSALGVHAIAEAKHRSPWPVTGWVTKIYYLRAPPCFGLTSGRRPVVKIIAVSLLQHDNNMST